MENVKNEPIGEGGFGIEAKVKSSPWFELRDIVFAAVVAAAILIIGFITVPIVVHIPIPGIRNVVSAPLSAVLLTIGAARIRKKGALVLVLGLSSLVYLLISPVIPAFVLSAAIIAELLNLATYRGYATRNARMVCITVLYTVMTPLGTLFGALLLGGKYQESLSSGWFLLGMTAAVLVLSFLGALAGEKIVKELVRAGKLR
jgi:energy-coupling factor transport system substrate-specific component